jgi:hypothetical protein
MRAGSLIAAVALVTALASAAPAQAGRPCETEAPSVAAVTQGMALAAATARALNATGEQVVVLARAGQDLSRYGLRWSHLGFAYRSGDAPGAPWRVLHKLNHYGTAEGELYRQGLGEFFLDRPYRYEAAFVALVPEVQAQLLPLLRDDASVARWHEPRYSVVAYPWAQRYQQSLPTRYEPGAGHEIPLSIPGP